ncbi:MAG: PaaI family thioesterase [Candidatus Nezhaarchaeales archaeon]
MGRRWISSYKDGLLGVHVRFNILASNTEASNSHNRKALALNLNINYRRPAKAGDTLIAEAFEESLGKTTALYKIIVRDSRGNIIAVCQGLVYRMDEPILA